MNVKKAGLVSAGVLAALVAASPLAWAVGPSQQADPNCSFEKSGADASESSEITEDNPINVVHQAPAGGDNAGVFGKCSTFNQHNGEGNGEGNTFNGTEIPAPPAVPAPPVDVPSALTDGVPPPPALPQLPG